MNSFNNASNVSHQLAAAAVVARNLQQQQQQEYLASTNYKNPHSLLPFQTAHTNSRNGLKQNAINSQPPSPSPPPPQIPPHSSSSSTLPAMAPTSLFENHCNDNLSLLTAQQKLASTSPFQANVVAPTSMDGPSAHTSTDSAEGATATDAASVAAAAALSSGIPTFLQQILHGKCNIQVLHAFLVLENYAA